MSAPPNQVLTITNFCLVVPTDMEKKVGKVMVTCASQDPFAADQDEDSIDEDVEGTMVSIVACLRPETNETQSVNLVFGTLEDIALSLDCRCVHACVSA